MIFRKSLSLTAAVLFQACYLCVTAPASAGYSVSGIQSGQRTEALPVIDWVGNDKSWYQHSLAGINPHYARRLYFSKVRGIGIPLSIARKRGVATTYADGNVEISI
jgi:hypothetical protein